MKKLIVSLPARVLFAISWDDPQMLVEVAQIAKVSHTTIQIESKRIGRGVRETITAPPDVIGVLLRDLRSAADRDMPASDRYICRMAEDSVIGQIGNQGFTISHDRFGRALMQDNN